jgi:Protein of unknown function (DUF2877)
VRTTARVVAAPAADRLAAGPAIVAGAGRAALYLDLDGFIAIAAAAAAPALPNGIALSERPERWPPPGTTVTIETGKARVWDPTLRLGDDPARRGGEILETLDQPYEKGQTPLARAVAARDPDLASRAAAALIGRGPGLTPEGDDVVAATAAVVAAGPWPQATKAEWLAALLPDELRRRTTALSATLLELAAAGQIAEPVHGLFEPRWREALERLLRLGHTTGHAYAAAAALAATRLPAP